MVHMIHIIYRIALYNRMDPREKLRGILEQKKKLHEKIAEIDNTDISQNKNDEKQLNQLLLRKKMLEDQKKKEEEYRKLEAEYNERKKQVERERQLERVRNEKRIIELQAAMKKVVFEGIKEKVKGMNSEQLMLRGYLATSNDPDMPAPTAQSSNFKDAFQAYLVKDAPEKLKPKYDLNSLNQRRMEIYEKKEEMVMKQILLKQLTASEQPIEMDVLNMNRQQLKEELDKRGIDLQDFMHPIRKEEVIDHYQSIRNQAQDRIAEKKRNINQQRAEKEAYQRYKRELREDVNKLPFKSLEVVKRLLYDLLDEICNDYDKRHVARSKQDQQEIAKKLQEEYDELWNRNLVDELSNSIIDGMLDQIRKEMVRDSAQEIAKLNELSHMKTEECFKVIFGEGDIAKHMQELNAYKLPLNFINEEDNHISKPKNDQYMKKLDNTENNVFETEDSTVSLVNDIQLLAEEEKYVKNVAVTIANQLQSKNDDVIFHYDRQLYSVGRHQIKAVHSGQLFHTFSQSLDSISKVNKVNRNWLIQSEQKLTLITPWNRQELGNAIGGRISNPCGKICFTCPYPVFTLLGSLCSVMIGFQKGQLLKYNFNINRITSRQTNLTQYHPVIEHAKTGDEPSFPLDNRDYIPIELEKAKPNDEIHQFRQFFEHHSEPIIFIEFYRVDRMITIDRGLKCALWQYSKTRGSATFQPIFKFQIKSSYQIYKEDQNPRYKDIFPTSNSKESPEDMYQKYMLTQATLKLQLYNNPKKEIAYFRSPSWDKEEGDKPIWKVTYKDSRKQVSKILESYYNAIDGTIVAEQAKLLNDHVYVLCEREHVIRTDLKTVKLYSWSIQEKKLGRVGLEIDMYREQKVSNFAILQNGLRGVDIELVVLANSGRVLLFSLVSGQLLKNFNDEVGAKRQLYFKSVISAADRQLLYGITANSVLELHMQDNNSINDRNKLNKTIDNVKRKFFR